MRTPDYIDQFARDYTREKKGPHRVTLDADLHVVLSALLADRP
ncbi:MAG: type II toxin-antitoxin system YafQ family toxin [Acidobacteriaceae bacterium]|jgi:mRNA interferase YafQ|nr:type II toxin-antitoxin system YafQ family toxin [Acidobacteriaceae bacterium]